MSTSYFTQGVLTGISITLGENEHRFDDDPSFYNNDEALCRRLKKTIGFGTRYQTNENTTTCDLCEDAARRLMREKGIVPEQINAIVSVTQTPDYYMPGNAYVLHDRLKLSKECAAVDMEMGCSGFVYGLWHSFMMVSSGLKRVLLVAGDTLSKSANPKDRTEYPLFCDAGAAAIIEHTDTDNPTCFVMRADGTGVSKMLQPAGAYRTRSSEETRREKTDAEGNVRSDENIYMNGFEIFNFTLTEQPAALREILEKSGKTKEEIDWFVFHQGNKYIVDTLAKSAGVPKEKVPVIFPDYGNQNAASIPGTICAALSDAFEARKQVVLQGFGIGLSWGACQTALDKPTILKPVVYGGRYD